ncbi:MAG TPA: DNRLRE domain-containing protein, partial [Trebonia sp.]|nr:DNRLRE domain-containing protein [Trebonia sp.]
STATVPGAVPAAARPMPVKFPDQGKRAPDNVRVLTAQAPPQKAGYNQETSRQLPLAGSSQVTYANADGTKTSFQYASSVNFQRADGTWAPISSSLVPAPSGGASQGASQGVQVSADALFEAPLNASPSPSVSVSPAASQSPSLSASSPAGVSPPAASPSASASPSNSSSTAPAGGWTEKSQAYPESFAASADAPALVTVPVDGSHSLSFGISGAGAATGAASGSTVSYADARPDSTVSFTAATGLVKESIVLSSPSAPDTWVFPLELKGLRALMGPGGIVEFADASGKVLAYVPSGFMTDSKIDPHSGDGARSFGVTYSLVAAGGQQAIKMTLDSAWLDSKDRVYPVTVDPSVSDIGANGTTYVQYPDDNDFSGDTEIHVGTWDGGSDKAQSYLAFGNVASQLKNDTVLGARLGVFNTWSYSCSPRPVYVYPVTSSWSVTGDKSWPGPSTGAAIGRASFATGWVPLGSTQSPCPASWEGFNLDQAGTNLVNGWTHGTVADNGLAIGASTSDSYAWKKFASDSGSTGNPFLAVTYTTDGASYKLAAKTPVTNVTPTTAGSFAVTVTNTGASTWTTSNGYQMGSVAYNAQGGEVSNSLVYTAMPSTVAPGQSVTVDVKVGALGAGAYRIVIGMYNGSQSFASQGIQDFEIGLYVPEPLPVVTGVYPPTGYTSTTLQQQLSTTATGTGTVTYDFTLTCEPLSGQTCTDATVSSGSISTAYWTPPAADLDWDIAYQWKVAVTATSNGQSATTTVGPVTIEAEPPQPVITSDLGAPSGQAYDPLSGNYTTSATDAAVKSTGPALEIDRTYNSMDPRTSGAFGAGWSSVVDASLENDTSTVLVRLPDGQEMRFGENGDGSYAPPFGSQDALVKSTSGTWTLRDTSAERYAFSSSGQLTSITEVTGYAQNFTYNSSNQVSTITDAISGRSLSLTWSKPSGATYAHVASVTTPAPATGGSGYTWTYSYTGDELTQACAPAATGSQCTAYSYGSGSHYLSSVLDADPRVYYQLGEASGATSAADEVAANLGTTVGTYHNVTLGTAAGPLAGPSETAAAFNGTSSYVSLPNNLLTDDTDVSVGLWFKAASGAHGVLFGYASGTISSGTTGAHVPALYIGTNGDLYGEFWTGTASPIATTSAVTDGKWHYAVLTASSSSQTLYLDGAKVNSLSGQVNQLNMAQDTVGAGYWGSWLNGGGSATATAIGYFNGDIGQVAVYQQPLSAATIASQYALAETASPELTQVTLPSGKTYEQASYDPGSARLATYTDPDGGQWTIGQPLATGTKTSSDTFGAVVENVSVTDPAGRQETYGYDITDGGRLISFDNGVDLPEVYGYDAAGFLTTVV